MKRFSLFSLALTLLAACASEPSAPAQSPGAAETPAGLPEPEAGSKTENYSNVTGWPEGKTPLAPAGFSVRPFATKLENPRWIFVAPDGDIFVAESKTIPRTEEALKKQKEKGRSEDQGPSANRITLLRDRNGDGVVDERTVFATGLNQPFGMEIVGNYFYVGATDGLWRFPYKAGSTKLNKAQGKKIVSLPAGGYNNHWTRNVLARPDGSKIYVSVGSGSNVGENGLANEKRRANILEVNPDGSGERIFASGLRNPVGMGWNPDTGALWTAVNERDELGDELVPDYLTSVKEGGFYGWPFAYMGKKEDPRRRGERPDLVEKTLDPEVLLGSHTASLGLAFYDQTAFPARYHGGAFVGQHGSWNHSELVGYKVVFVPFKNGKPAGPMEDFLTGFLKGDGSNDAYGRPVGVATLPNGKLLVADDAGGTIWHVQAN
jgi:glucose/arabinose dehydrogenase